MSCPTCAVAKSASAASPEVADGARRHRVFGCTVTTAPVPTPVALATEAAGTLVVSWTIEGRDDRVGCDTAAAIGMRIHLVTTAGADAGT